MNWSLARVVLQEGVDVNIELGNALGGGAVGTFMTTLVVGAILVALAPEYTQSRMADVLDEPVDAFVYGLFVLLALVVLVFALVLSIVGILVVIPLIVVAYVVWAFGAAVAFLAIAERLLDRRRSTDRESGTDRDHGRASDQRGADDEWGRSAADEDDSETGSTAEIDVDDWLPVILVAAVLNGGLVLTGVGSLLAFCVGAAGFGAVTRDWLE